MKVLHILKVQGIGGAERHLLTLLPALRDDGLHTSVLSLDAGGDSTSFHRALAEQGIPCRRVRCGFDVSPRLAAAATRAVRAERPDLIHTHLAHGDLYGSLAAEALGIPFVSSRHNDDRYLLGAYRHVNRLFMRRVRKLIVASDALAEFMVRVGLSYEKIATIPYGLDTPPARPSELTPKDAGVPDDAPLILAVGRLVEQKDHATLLRAFAHVLSEQPSARLGILGSGPLERAVRAQAATLGLRDAVVLPGRTEPRDWLQRAEIFVHPSRWEGFGIVLLEAMLSGLPIVATRVSGVPEIVAQDKTGYLVRPGDHVAMANALTPLLADPNKGRTLGHAGLERAKSTFSVARMTAAVSNLYQEARSAC